MVSKIGLSFISYFKRGTKLFSLAVWLCYLCFVGAIYIHVQGRFNTQRNKSSEILNNSTEMHTDGYNNQTYLLHDPNYVTFWYPSKCITYMRNLITFINVRSAFVLSSRNKKKIHTYTNEAIFILWKHDYQILFKINSQYISSMLIYHCVLRK